MATHPRTTVSEPTRLEVVPARRKNRQRRPPTTKGRIISTAFALIVLALVLRYLPPSPRNAQASEPVHPVAAAAVAPTDVRLNDVQVSGPPGGGAVYLDGMVANDGKVPVSEVEVQVDFHDAHGTLVASLQKPIAGVAAGGVDLLRKEFARNPIEPGQMRFFRVEVQPVPEGWNHELPAMKVVTVAAK